MKHPFQILVADKRNEHLFVSVKNHLLVFRLADGKLVGSWMDTVDLQTIQAEKFRAKRAEEKRLREATPDQQPSKRAKTNKKEPKIPVPGPGAPIIYNYIRSICLTRNEKYIIGTTDSDKAVVILSIDFTKDNCLSLVKRQVFPKRPCAVLTTVDDKSLVLADKFGDVYELPIDASAPVDEKELVPILGHVSMLSDVLVAEHEGKQFILTGDRDEHIKVTHYPKSYVVKHWLFGHHEFVSTLHSCNFGENILVSGGGDDYLMLWNWWTNEILARVELRELVLPFLNDSHLPPERFLQEDSPTEISIARVASLTNNGENLLIVLAENTKCLLTFVVGEDFSVTHKQTLTSDYSIIDFAVVNNTVVAAVDVESDDHLLELYKFNQENLLEAEDTDIAKTISLASTCEVEGRNDFYPLYYVSTLRKRSEH